MTAERWAVLAGVFILALGACSKDSGSGDDDGDAGTPTPLADADGDGYAVDEDCNDADAAIYPGATEVCDQVDNNCDGIADEGFPMETYYPDQDGDGYGDDGGAVTSCASPDGYVSQNGDCDDSDAGVNPAATEEVCNGVDEDCSGMTNDHPDQDGDGYDICAPEVPSSDGLEVDCDDASSQTYPGASESCDEVDNDCDGVVDEDLELVTYYRDADADLHGDPDDTVEACAPPPGYVSEGDDCDDTDATVFPGAPEVYQDGTDSNCNGYSDYVVTVSGTGPGFSDGDLSEARFNNPSGMVMDRQGNLYVADTGNHAIRKIAEDGTVSTIAGTGTAGLADTYGSSAQFDSPTALAIDSTGSTLYIADTGNNRIRALDLVSKYVTTVVGDGETQYEGEEGFAMDAHLNAPQGLAYTSTSFLLVADTGNHIIRQAGPFGKSGTPLVQTIAGTGEAGQVDNPQSSAAATSVPLDTPKGIVVDTTGTIYFSDSGNQTVREIEKGQTILFAGIQDDTTIYNDDGSMPTAGTFNNPSALVMNTSRLIIVCDTGNNRLRAVITDNATRYIVTIAGSAELDPDTYVSEGEAREVPLSAPNGGALDLGGVLWFSDTGHHVIRKLIP